MPVYYAVLSGLIERNFHAERHPAYRHRAALPVPSPVAIVVPRLAPTSLFNSHNGGQPQLLFFPWLISPAAKLALRNSSSPPDGFYTPPHLNTYTLA